MKYYLVAYVLGGIIMFASVNQFLYPLPTWLVQLHGPILGLFDAAVFAIGSVVACGLTWLMFK